ncbi:hypothetical protein Agabi119p4_10038 [Agaricus bisporus var. burnettii]|uniref:Cytochrome P450 n=1 Tax=Agaricus bisporus var. burnettii TaxID=192524 RepID=A0A8H7EW14_AGABI|nr:hypothetical protein Agabi119p4_10038 [Agaricus bisporus var. burnettii]
MCHPLSLAGNVFSAFVLLYALAWSSKWIWRSFFPSSRLRDIPGPPPESWVKGQLFNAKGLEFHQNLVERYGGMVKVYGFFGDEQLYVSDSRALQSILVKEHDAFEETSVFLETNKVIFGPGLVATKGDQHRRQRKATLSIFGVPQLRQILPTLYDISDKLCDVLSVEFAGNRMKTIDMSNWMSRVALESVGRTVLGYSFDPLDSPHNNPYTSAIKELIPTIFKISLIRQFAPFLVRLGPPWLRRKLVEWTPSNIIQKLKDMSDIMHAQAKEILELKRQELRQNPHSVNEIQEGQLKDIISELIRMNELAPASERLDENELTGQMTVLVFGAQDTTSASLSRILWQLSHRPDIQEKIRGEIQALRNQKAMDPHNARLSYEDLIRLSWLDAVIKETLRLYPPVPFVRRVATRDCTLPYMRGDEVAYTSIPSGTILFVGIAGSNRSQAVWGDDAQEWKPERWLGNKGPKEKVPGIYSGMMSFLGGQRSCVGYRFADIEMKIILSTLLTKFRLSATDDEIVWNLSQIISPSIRNVNNSAEGIVIEEKKGLPLIVEEL